MFVPEYNRYPFTLMKALAMNIEYFHTPGRISDAELEDIFVYLIAEGDYHVNAVFEKVETSKVKRGRNRHVIKLQRACRRCK